MAALGNATIQTGTFWDEVIKKLSAIVAGTGASVFELEETEQDIIKYVCKASTGLYDRNGNKIDADKISKNKIYYEETLKEEPKSLTTWVARYKGNAIIKRTYGKEEFEKYYSLHLNKERTPGRGQYNEHPDDISIIMVPIMSLDRKRVDAVIRIAKERKLSDDKDSGFSDEQIKLFLSIIPAISKIFLTARRLELLESLSSRAIENREQLYEKVVNTVPKLLGAPGCTLLVSRYRKLFGAASSAPHIQRKIANNEFQPYDFGQGYTGFVAGKNIYLFLNDRKEADGYGIRWSGREYECEVGEKIRTCDRFLAVPVRSYLGKEVIGVIRTAKMRYHDPFSEIDRILLEVFADRLSLTIEEVEREHREREEQRKRIENTFSKFLVDECKHLDQVKCKGDIKGFFYDLETPKSDIRTVTLEKINLLWKKFLKISFEVGNQLYQFENNILGKVPGYRDHFLHQFQVFLVGIYIIDRLIYFKSSANSLSEKEDWEKLEKGWILTANFHDMASTIALIEKWLPKVVGVLLKEAKDIIGPSQFSKIVHDPQQNYYVYLEKMGEILERKGKPKLNFMKESLVRLEKGDHGLLSALSLLGNILGRTEDLINEAGLAIALHTMALADEERKLSKIEMGHIIFDELPLVFLLLYCDNLHEWGRDLSGLVSNKDNSFDPKNFNIIVTKEMPNILLKNKELKGKIEKIGNSSNIIYAHAEIFVDEVDEVGFQNKKQRLTQLFNVIKSDNPLFSVHLNKSFLYDSLTQTLIDTRADT